MASSSQFALSLFLIAAVALLFSPAHSLNCTSQTFSQRNANFTSCTDLPALSAFLHWTYNPTARPNSTLEIAFIAPPASPQGWVAWALNPTGHGMLGAQSLIAFRDANGSMVVRTYNISSYSSIAESRISYGVLSSRAEYSGGLMRIFATLVLPSGGSEVNQVWQVGSSVSNGVPVRHNFSAENLSSRNTLQLVGTGAGNRNGMAPAPAPRTSGGGGADSPSGRRGTGNDTGESSILGNGLGLYAILVLIGVWFWGS